MLQHFIEQLHILGGGDPPRPAASRRRGIPAHCGDGEAVEVERDDAGGVHPVLEEAAVVAAFDSAVAECQVVEVGGVVGAEPAPEGDVLAAADHLQGVELHPSDAVNGVIDGFGVGRRVEWRHIESLRVQGEGASGGERVGSLARGHVFMVSA